MHSTHPFWVWYKRLKSNTSKQDWHGDQTSEQDDVLFSEMMSEIVILGNSMSAPDHTLSMCSVRGFHTDQAMPW